MLFKSPSSSGLRQPFKFCWSFALTSSLLIGRYLEISSTVGFLYIRTKTKSAKKVLQRIHK